MKHEQTPQGTRLPVPSVEEPSRLKGTRGIEKHTKATGSVEVHNCANCDIEFFWPATLAKGQIYCCSGCAAGGPCTCDYSLHRSVTITGIIYYEK